MSDTKEEEEPMEIETSIINVDEKFKKNHNTIDDDDDDDVDVDNNDSGRIIPTLDEFINNNKNNINNTTTSRWENKNGTFTTGIDIFSKEEKLKMEERAKRFGIDSNNINNINDLYDSMNIIDDIDKKKIRLNVLHMRGTDNMSTKDVFKYFEDYGASSIEWINDVSCNIVWLDNISSARALIHLSKKINYNNDDDNYSIKINDIKCPLPPGVWRKGNDYNKSNNIFLRFATINDKKQPNAEKTSVYYKKYGNPNYGGIKGLLSESKKQLLKQKKRKYSDNNEDVYDDDNNINNNKKKKSNPWGELSERWGNNDNTEEYYIVNKKPNLQFNNDIDNDDDDDDDNNKMKIKNRLGFKSNNEIINYKNKSDDNCSNNGDDDDSSTASDGDDEMNVRSKIPRMRMHADDEEERVKRKKLKQITQKKREESRDLRSRLGKKKPQIYRDEIQVIVTNRPEVYKKKQQEVKEDEEEEEEVKMFEESEKEDGELEDEFNDNQLIHNKIFKKDTKNDDEEEEEEGEIDDNDESSSTSESELSEKEIQGPQGSVIKVVAKPQRVKPQVASTVWTRLNFNAENKNSSSNNRAKVGDRLIDLRSRLGNKKKNERSPLRIEVKNEKYEGNLNQDYSD
ncbi:hypothetical protein HCN44_007470 [Aphidius gifuensis]|uniref:Nuclear cap-binding protein subunit 3 n=1 Tax=Aphidius gifuensis TaxID=684658 RepID=A0A834XLJ1_APHGI|nr:nuclear cap-binding protein subunit 3-like [Aphidius gifuensis]KAF7989160.1 hypothetical protein HCN44_007470 [Aphidius gifuensis]